MNVAYCIGQKDNTTDGCSHVDLSVTNNAPSTLTSADGAAKWLTIKPPQLVAAVIPDITRQCVLTAVALTRHGWKTFRFWFVVPERDRRLRFIAKEELQRLRNYHFHILQRTLPQLSEVWGPRILE